MIASLNKMSFLLYAPPIVFDRKVKEIGGIELEPWLTRPFCHTLMNVRAGQLV